MMRRSFLWMLSAAEAQGHAEVQRSLLAPPLARLSQIFDRVNAMPAPGIQHTVPLSALSKDDISAFLAFNGKVPTSPATVGGPTQEQLQKLFESTLQGYREDLARRPKLEKPSDGDGYREVGPGEQPSIDAVSRPLHVVLAEVLPGSEDCVLYAPEFSKRVVISHAAYTSGDVFDVVNELRQTVGSAAILIGQQKAAATLAPVLQSMERVGFQLNADASFETIAECLLSRSKKPPSFAFPDLCLSLGASTTKDAARAGSFASPLGWTVVSKLVGEANSKAVLSVAGTIPSALKPAEALNLLVHPAGDVVVVSVVTVGSGMNLSAINLRTTERFVAHGCPEDILSGFMAISRDGPVILLPNPSADSYTLSNCRQTLLRADRVSHIVWPSSFHDKLVAVGRVAEPGQLRALICDALKWKTADLVMNAKKVAGRHIRKSVLDRSQNEYLEVAAASLQDDWDTVARAQLEGGAGNWPVHPTIVREYLERLNTPERKAVEAAASEKFTRYLVVSMKWTVKSHLNRVANPYHGGNYVYAAGFVDCHGSKWIPFRIFSDASGFKFPDLSGYDVLILNDAKDALVMIWDDPQLKSFIKRGGRIWDTTVAEYLLSAQRTTHHNTSLSRLAASYGIAVPGAETRADVEVSDLCLMQVRAQVSRELLFLGGVFHSQIERGVNQLQLLSIASRMDSLLASIEIEKNGLFVNEPEALRIAHDRLNAVKQAEEALRLHTPAQIPLDYADAFKWSSSQHLEALFWGGTLRFGRTLFVDRQVHRQTQIELSFLGKALSSYHDEEALREYAAKAQLLAGGSESPVSIERVRDLILKQLFRNRANVIKKYKIVFFDVETTGLAPDTDRIVELSFFDWQRKKWFESLVHPGIALTAENMQIHKISDEDLANAPPFSDVVPELLEFLQEAKGDDPDAVVLLLSHNCWKLDEPILRQELLRAVGDAQPSLMFADTLAIFQEVCKGPSKRLQDLGGYYKVKSPAAHRARDDVELLQQTLLKALKCENQTSAQQRLAVLEALGATMRHNSLTSPFHTSATFDVQLPGLVHEFFPNNAAEMTLRLRPRMFDLLTLTAFEARGCAPATLLRTLRKASESTSKLLALTSDGKRLHYLYPNSCLHQAIDAASTATTRTSSSNPSLQNVPKDDKSDVRRIFVSRFGAQGCMIEIDYAALEIAVQAVLCRDPKLLAELRSGIDFHIKRASWLDPKRRSYAELMRLKKDGDREVITLRRKAKVIGFQRLYGAGSLTIARHAEVSKEQVERMIEEEEAEYPGIKQFQKTVRLVALRAGNPGLPTHYVFELPTGCRMSFDGRSAHHNLPILKNYPIQGYAAELVQAMMGKLYRHFLSCDSYGQQAKLVNFVHDSVWIDCHEAVLPQVVSDTERILSGIKEHFTQTYPNVDIPLDFTVATEVGRSLYCMKSYAKFLAEANVAPPRGNDSEPEGLLLQTELDDILRSDSTRPRVEAAAKQRAQSAPVRATAGFKPCVRVHQTRDDIVITLRRPKAKTKSAAVAKRSKGKAASMRPKGKAASTRPKRH